MARTAYAGATRVDGGTNPGEIDFLINTLITDYIFLRAHVVLTAPTATTIYTEEVQLFISVVEPCLQAGIIQPNAITNIEYWIRDPTQTTQLGAGYWDDTPSITYSTANYCGPKNIELVASDQSTAVTASHFTLSTT